MNSILLKSSLRAVKNTFSRFISIVLIIAVGLAFFAGIKATSPDMKATARQYFTDNNLFDIRVQATLGMTNSDVRAISEVEGVEYVMPAKFIDALVWVNGEIESDIDGSQISTRAYSIDLEYLSDYQNGIVDGSFINKPTLLEGNYPKAANECLVDASALSTPESFQIGSTIRLEGDGDSIFATLNTNEFKIVGIIRDPYYVSFERGNSLVGSGKIGTYIYIPSEAFDTDYYCEVYAKVRDAGNLDPYSDEYFDFVNETVERIEAISGDRISVRATQINISVPTEVAEATAELEAAKTEASTEFADAESTIATLRNLAENGDVLLAQAQAEYNAQFTAAQQQLLDGQTDYNEKLQSWSEMSELVSQAEAQWNEQYNNYIEQQNIYNNYLSLRNTAATQLQTAQNYVNTLDSLISTIRTVMTSLSAVQTQSLSSDQIQNIISVLQNTYPELYTSISTITAQGTVASAISLIEPILSEKEAELATAKAELEEKTSVFNAYDAALTEAQQTLSTAETTLSTYKTYLESAELQLNTAKTELDAYAGTLTDGQNSVTLAQIQAQQQLYQLQSEVANAASNLELAEKALSEARADYDAEISLAQTKIDKAYALLGNISEAKWSVMDRSDTPGYTSLSDSLDSIAILGNLFPLFFILVAAVVVLTTMTRLIAEERTQIGTLKALGYDNSAIVLKYAIYAFLAAIFGSAIGISLGLYFFPKAINAAFGIMYDLPELIITYPVHIILIGVAIAIVSTVVTTVFACMRELRGEPSHLMRPKAPKTGKHVLLEKIPFIWKKLSFSSRITVRNTFRNIGRCLMTTAGIAGCTGLILASFGLYDSISAIMQRQFEENPISKYDFQVVFDEAQSLSASTALAAIKSDTRVSSAMLTSMTSMTGSSERTDKNYDVYVLVPEYSEQLSDYVTLTNRQTGENFTLDDRGALITEKFADETKTEIGDYVTVTDGNGKTYEIRVAGIVENYTFHYIYLSRTAYCAIFGKDAEFSYAWGKLTDKVRTEAENAISGSVTDKTLLATDLMKNDSIMAVSYKTDTIESFTEIIDALSFIIIVFMISAAVLAFVVLYNLSNTNIQERRREIATLKVLGYYDNEVSSYIFHENIILTIIGAVLGLLLGIGGFYLIVNNIEIDTVMFGKTIKPMSFVFALLATFTFAIFVNLIMGKKLKKTKPTESLKTLE